MNFNTIAILIAGILINLNVQAKEFKDYELLYQKASAPHFKDLIGDWTLAETSPTQAPILKLYHATGGTYFESQIDENMKWFEWQSYSRAMFHTSNEKHFNSAALEVPGMRFFYTDKVNQVVSVILRRHFKSFDDVEYFAFSPYYASYKADYLEHEPWKHSSFITNSEAKNALVLKTITFQYEVIQYQKKGEYQRYDEFVGTHFISLNQYNDGFRVQTVKGPLQATLKDVQPADEFCRITVDKNQLICRVEGLKAHYRKPFCGYRVFNKVKKGKN